MITFIVTLLIVWFIFSSLRLTKKVADARPRQEGVPRGSVSPGGEAGKKVDLEEEHPMDLADFSGKTAKSEPIFTYETWDEPEGEILPENEIYSEKKVENPAQTIENKKEKNIDITLDGDEIRKAIIYSEILKRPNY